MEDSVWPLTNLGGRYQCLVVIEHLQGSWIMYIEHPRLFYCLDNQLRINVDPADNSIAVGFSKSCWYRQLHNSFTDCPLQINS